MIVRTRRFSLDSFGGQDDNTVAEDLALEAGILKRCRWHQDFVCQEDWDLEPVYQLAASRFNRGDIRGFLTLRDLRHSIKAVIAAAPVECPRCEHLRGQE
jgi:hypothetical protein